MPGDYDGCIQYELEVQRMIYEGGAIFQDEVLRRKKTSDKNKDVNGSEP